jgi:ribosomal protein S12 methylthiotransferase
MSGRYWIETLGCPKNEVDSAKLAGTLLADGYVPAEAVADADLVVVNTCAFIEPARLESIETILALHDVRSEGSRLVVTGCLAERYGAELASELPEVDLVAGFGVPVQLGPSRRGQVPAAKGFDLLELPRPPSVAPWAYVKVAEGCDRVCGFCAIPSFRGKQRSRSIASILAEVEALGVREVVLVAQDLASWGRDQATPRSADAGAAAGGAAAPIVGLIRAVAERVERVRALYLYPSALTPPLVDAILDTGVPYFDLSLQHASGPLLRKMRRFGDGDRFLRRVEEVRAKSPEATMRSSFIVGYPGETEEDHDELLSFLTEAQIDWAGFFAYSEEAGTHAAGLDGKVQPALVEERLRECGELQDRITAARRSALIGTELEVLVDSPGSARSHREAPVIDGVVKVPTSIEAGTLTNVLVTGACGPDLEAVPAPEHATIVPAGL